MKEAEFVDKNHEQLVARVKSVMPLADDLLGKNMIPIETYSEIRAENTNQKKMRKLLEALNSGGDQVKIAFFNALRKNEPFLFEELGGRLPSRDEKVKTYKKESQAPKISYASKLSFQSSELNLDSHTVCECCVDIVDSDQWVQVEPSVCRDEGESKFRISTEPGHYECIRTRMRWVCDCDVTLQYHTVDGRSLIAELERLQYERIGPVIDVTVISGKLKEAHLPHYVCIAESDPSLKDTVKVLSLKYKEAILENVELTRFHAKIFQPCFSPKTVLIKLGISVKVHCNLLLYMTRTDPIILHVYFFPSDSGFTDKIKMEEKSSYQIKCSRPEMPLQMMKQYSLEVPGAEVQPRQIKLRGDIEPNFFQVKQPKVDDVKMILKRVEDQKSKIVWTATIWKELTKINESNLSQFAQSQNLPQLSHDDKVKFFNEHWHIFIRRVTKVKAIADELLQKNIIYEEIYSEITLSTDEEGMRKICGIVRKSSDAVKEDLVSILLKEEPDLFK